MASKQDKQLKEITKKLEEGVKDMLTSENYTEYLKVMSQFHDYSFNNTMLIAMQKPEATLVAGYQAWQKKFERHVKKGEKGIQIIAPAPIREKEEVEKIDPVTKEPILKENGQPETEVITHVIPRFRITTVFDVSQTDGKPLPEFGVEDLTASVENYEAFMQAITNVSPVPIRYDEIEGSSHGYYHLIDKEVVIQIGMSESQTMKTAIHEVSHAKLHAREIMEEQGIWKDKLTKEVEAESIAYCVCQYFGLDTSEYSFPYIGSWSSGKDMKELRASMDTIRKTAGEFIDSMTVQLQELLKEGPEIEEISMDDAVLRISGSMGSDYEYCVVKNMSVEQLEGAVRDYARLIEQDAFIENDVPLEEYLEERGAEVIAMYASNGLGEDYPVDFFDVEYDVDTGITVFEELSGQRQAEMLIAKAEYKETVFNDAEKNLITNYAYKFDNPERTRSLVEAIMQAHEQPDLRAVSEVMEAAQNEIDDLPDGMVGFTELHNFGYLKEGMLPLTMGRAVELHHLGVPVFALRPHDNSLEPQENLMDTELAILEEGGMFGVTVSAWETHKNQRLELEKETQYQEVELFDVPALFANERIHSDILPEGIYRYELQGSDYDPGYPVTVESQVMVNHAGTILTAVPIELSELGYFRLGEEINFTGGMETIREYQQAMAGVDQNTEMEKMENAIGRANENLFLDGFDDRYAIYQINQNGKGREYQFMGMDFATSHDLSVEGADYRFIYGGRLSGEETLDSIYERFNLDHPETYEGHSLSVSDVIIMQRNHQAKAYYVDSFGFKELPEFVRQRLHEVEIKQKRDDSLVMSDTSEIETEAIPNYPPVYQHTLDYAMEHAAADEYLDSRKLNIDCKRAVEDAIRNHFDGLRLAHDAAETVLEEYGQERLSFVLACSVQYQSSDGRISKDTKEWAESIVIPENISRGIDANLDYVVNSHPGVLDVFIGLARQRFVELEKIQEPEKEGISLTGEQADVLDKIACASGMDSWFSVGDDNTYIHDFENNEKLPLKEGIQTLYEGMTSYRDYNMTSEEISVFEDLLEKMGIEVVKEEISLTSGNTKPEKALQQAEMYLDNHDTELAYKIEPKKGYLFIQTSSEGGYDYTFYDEDYREVDGGIYDNGDLSVGEVIDELISEQYGMTLPEPRIIDCEQFLDIVDRAEYFPQKSYEALKELMNSGADEIAFRVGYGYVSVQKIPEGYEYIDYDDKWQEIGGDIYDDPDTSMEDVVSWIFKNERLGDLDCVPLDYEEVVKGTLQSAKERLSDDKLTATSQISRRETALGGNSRHDIEETVLCYAQSELEEMGMDDDVKLFAARVYGSRSRKGLYTENSDIDVVLSYSGDIQEDDFFNRLHEHGMKIGGLTIDINPISTEKTGSLEDYMEQAEKYLDQKEMEKLAADIDAFAYDNDFYEYQDRVEDREQAVREVLNDLTNGRADSVRSWLQVFVDEGEPEEIVSEAQMLIDRINGAEEKNLLHQPEQPEPSISFYVAECMEYPVMGEYHENLTLQEAFDLYEKIPAERINGIKGIGFCLEDGSIYNGTFELMSAGTVIKDVINEIPHYRESPLVQKAIADMETILSRQKAAVQGKEAEKDSGQIADINVKQEREKAFTEEKTSKMTPKENSSTRAPETGRKESVLKALREWQEKLKTQEQGKQPKEQSQTKKKGDQEL